MNYEQKYKEALEWMRSIYPTMQGADKEDAEHHFPELRESEDERIRKELYRYFRDLQLSSDREFSPSISIDEILAWLEKQGEQKPTNKVEPKFKVGDVIRNKWSNHSKEIVAVDDYQYTLNDGMPAQPFKVDIKEQDNWEIVEQKPAWSEEDEQNLQFWLDNNKSIDSDKRNWLKSIKERVQPQPNQEWSEEDDRICRCLIKDQEKALDDVRNDKYGHSEIISDLEEMYRERINWLKSIKSNHWKPSEEQIGALDYAYCELFKRGENGEGSNCVHPLMTLIDDLKKL